jgi:hypothetical protein
MDFTWIRNTSKMAKSQNQAYSFFFGWDGKELYLMRLRLFVCLFVCARARSGMEDRESGDSSGYLG